MRFNGVIEAERVLLKDVVMSFSFSSMVRLTVLLAISGTIVAVGVSRLDPPKALKRSRQPVTNFNINDFFLNVADHKPRWLDSETGEMTLAPFFVDDVLEAASSSPWVDESGHHQVVGRWANRTFEGPRTISDEFGLARFSFPDGRVLDRVPTETYPAGPPCWLPGVQARVLFAAGDGQLYRFSFESDFPTTSSEGLREPVDSEPKVLTWACPKPEGCDVFIGDISWPEDPRMGGRLVVSLRVHERDEFGARRFSKTQLWWLKLNHSATRIIEAGPLINHDLKDSLTRSFDERSPTVAALPDGSLGLAYTRQTEFGLGWSVCLATLSTDTEHRPVPAIESKTRLVVPQSYPAPLAFSSNGKWLNALVGEKDSDESIGRFSTDVGPLASLGAGSLGSVRSEE